MSYDKHRLILDIPHIPYGDPSLIGDSEWARLKKEFPDSYKEAQRQIKAHEEKHAPKLETPAPATGKGEGK